MHAWILTPTPRSLFPLLSLFLSLGITARGESFVLTIGRIRVYTLVSGAQQELSASSCDELPIRATIRIQIRRVDFRALQLESKIALPSINRAANGAHSPSGFAFSSRIVILSRCIREMEDWCFAKYCILANIVIKPCNICITFFFFALNFKENFIR